MIHPHRLRRVAALLFAGAGMLALTACSSAQYPNSIFTQFTIVTRWREDGVALALNDRNLKERSATGEHDTEVDPADLGDVLREQFGLDLPPDDLGALMRTLSV